MTKLLQQALDALEPFAEDAARILCMCDYCAPSFDDNAVHPDNKAQQERPASVDAYVGAREDAAIWRKRALEAEELNRKFIAEVNGPTYLGEPVKQEQPAQEPVAWLHGTTFQVVVSKNRPNSLAAWLPLFAHPAPTQPVIKPVVVNADYREMWQQVIELNQQLCEKLAEPPTQPALSDDEIWQFWCNRPEVPEGEDDSMEAEFVAACKRAIESHCRGGNHG